MTREIKFRVWDANEKRFPAEGEIYLFDAIKGYRKNLIAEQYTGLKDKNGKEIYEGDIVKYLSYRKEYTGQVVFDFVDDSEGYYVEKHYGWGIQRDGYNLSLGDYADEDMKCELVEVIGNIHENGDLLEKGE